MTRHLPWLALAVCLAAGCGHDERSRAGAGTLRADLPPDRRDAEMLGKEVFELVDRAIDYRGSHRGRPASSLRQLGVDSLTPLTARSIINLAREPVVTVSFRRTDGREIISCRGDSQILEEASVNGGRFTLMCTARSGAQRPVRVEQTANR